MKKILALILALVMALSLVACGSKDNNDTPDDGKKTNSIKVGLICIGDENDQGYTYNFIRGKEAATEALAAKGINVEWVIKYNKGENDDCTNANIECAEEGCQLIINNSYGHEPFMLKVAGKSEYKDIQFIGCTNCGSYGDNLENTHNAFANIYEGRYLAGIAAGMKAKEIGNPKLGYVGAYPFAEVVSGFTAFYLGAKSVYPEVTMEYLERMAPYIPGTTLVMDCCGVKQEVCKVGFRLAEQYGFTFVGGHPMAGTQFSGFANSKADMFDGAPMVVVPPQADDILLLDRVKKLLTPAGFAHLTVTTAEHHDEMIAYTSQMCHVISNAYVKSPRAQMHKGYSAGSYMDLTRVAWLNEHMWTDLFLENRTFLLQELDQMIGSLQEYREALEQGNGDRLCTLLAEGRICKEKVDGQ